jgi:hypothetical protein
MFPLVLSPYVFCQAERAKAGPDAKLKAADPIKTHKTHKNKQKFLDVISIFS